MERKEFYHMYSNGDDAKNFIVCEEDFRFEFNLIAVCAFCSGVTVLGFSLEDTHLHTLLYGTRAQVYAFKSQFERSSIRHISVTRGSRDGVVLDCSVDLITDEEHLISVAAYVIIQPTKDGKPVQYYDYKWGSGPLYFRKQPYATVWLLDENSRTVDPVRYGDLKSYEKAAISGRMALPDEWLVASGLVLPQNYVDVRMYESIFVTHNRFRVFAGAGKRMIEGVQAAMAGSRGVMMDDLEARGLCRQMAKRYYGSYDVRRLDLEKRLRLAADLMRMYHMTFRQLATLTHLPESEIRKYLG